MESIIEWYLQNLNYWSIALLMAIESTIIPLPSELIVLPAAYLAANGVGGLNIVVVVISATIGVNIGALINYSVAKYLGRPLVYAFANSRIGHLFLLNETKVQEAESYFTKHGKSATFIGRLIPGLRHLISIPAGLAKMKLSTFILYTTVGGLLWNCILAAMGYYLHEFITLEELQKEIGNYSHEISLGVAALLLGAVGYLIYKGVKKRKTVDGYKEESVIK